MCALEVPLEPPRRLSSSKDTSRRLSSREVSPQKEAAYRETSLQLKEKLTERGSGSLLRGWRRELDLDGLLEVNFQDFCKFSARVGFCGDAIELFHALTSGDQASTSLTLAQFAPAEGALVHRFQKWVKDVFDGPMPMFSALDTERQGRVSSQNFQRLCREHGFEASDPEMEELYCCADVDDNGQLAQDDVIFLETDAQARDLQIFKIKSSQKDQYDRLMAWAYVDDGKRGLPSTHRLAQRPWLAERFERLPVLVCQRRVECRREIYRRSLGARITFLSHIRDTYGNDVRAWRRGLDPASSFSFGFVACRQYCRRVDLKVDVNALWKSLDKDGDGVFRLEELCVRNGAVLAAFQRWAQEQCGSCAALWDRPESVTARARTQSDVAWASDKKMLLTAFGSALEDIEWPGLNAANTRTILFSSLDLLGCGFISREDLEWLDMWKPPEWLCAEPDPAAWDEIRALMMRIYQHPLRAWRNLLDLDNSNSISWTEFSQACQKIKYTGNVGGAWRVLDADLSGAISMDKYDEPTYALLASFKNWAEKSFGSVEVAFKTLDTTGTGQLSYSELKRACHKLKWQGEVRMLFDVLDCETRAEDAGKRCLTLKDVCFLDSWEEVIGEQKAEEKVVSEALAKRRKPPKTAPQTRSTRRGLTREFAVERPSSSSSCRRRLADDLAGARLCGSSLRSSSAPGQQKCRAERCANRPWSGLGSRAHPGKPASWLERAHRFHKAKVGTDAVQNIAQAKQRQPRPCWPQCHAPEAPKLSGTLEAWTSLYNM